MRYTKEAAYPWQSTRPRIIPCGSINDLAKDLHGSGAGRKASERLLTSILERCHTDTRKRITLLAWLTMKYKPRPPRYSGQGKWGREQRHAHRNFAALQEAQSCRRCIRIRLALGLERARAERRLTGIRLQRNQKGT